MSPTVTIISKPPNQAAIPVKIEAITAGPRMHTAQRGAMATAATRPARSFSLTVVYSFTVEGKPISPVAAVSAATSVLLSS